MTDLHTDVERYLRYLSVERQLSPITLLNYQRQLEAIINFASENGLQSWQQCDVTMVRNFAVRSRRKGLGAASLALRLSALRSFFDWLVSQNELKANPAKGVSAPKAPRHLPKNIDVDDMNRLLDIDINDPLAVRDRAMLEVMYGAGLRLSELVGLDIKHLDLESGEVWVMGKGSKERRLPIGRNAVAWIEPCFMPHSAKRFCTLRAEIRLPSFDRKSASSSLPNRSRKSSQCSIHATALRPIGRRRSLLPFPIAGSCQPLHHANLYSS